MPGIRNVGALAVRADQQHAWVLCVGQYASSPLGPRLNTEFLVNLRPVLGTVHGEQNPVVNLAVGQYEANRGPLGSGCLLEDKHLWFE